MLPLDRLARAGATNDELAALQALTPEEQLSIENELRPVAESGVIDFLERYRLAFEPEDAEESEPDQAPKPPAPPADPPKASTGGSATGGGARRSE